MKLILGQGNPGPEYAKTRHNVGFMALDFYAAKQEVAFQPKSKFHAEIAEVTLAGEKILLAKPTTFYNETGLSARALTDFYKVDPTDVLVIHDELALPFGTVRVREEGSDAGNNGIKSLNNHLGQSYARIRVGTWNDHADKLGPFDFVLSKFTEEELSRLTTDILPKVTELIDEFIDSNHTPRSYRL